MQELILRPQELQVEVQLTRRAAAPEEVARELERRLRALQYVLSADWSAKVFVDDGDRYLKGVVTVLPIEQLPEDDPDLVDYRECFQLPGVLGPEGQLPMTASQRADEAIWEFDRQDRERRLRAAFGRWEDLQREFRTAEPELAGYPFPELSPVMTELSVVLNGLWEEFDLASLRACEGSTDEGRNYDYDQAYAAGLRWAGTMLLNEATRRGLPFVAEGAPWPDLDGPPE
jgi:hypothetical protein